MQRRKPQAPRGHVGPLRTPGVRPCSRVFCIRRVRRSVFLHIKVVSNLREKTKKSRCQLRVSGTHHNAHVDLHHRRGHVGGHAQRLGPPRRCAAPDEWRSATTRRTPPIRDRTPKTRAHGADTWPVISASAAPRGPSAVRTSPPWDLIQALAASTVDRKALETVKP